MARTKAFVFERKVQLFHTDAAGILFYSRVFDLAFEAFDALLASIGVSVAHIIEESDFLFPYVHAEADFVMPVYVGEHLQIHVLVERVGESSCGLYYEFFTSSGELALTAKTVHVSIDKRSKKKIPLPPRLRNGLISYLT